MAASAIATLVKLAGPERVIVGAGTGFTGRRAMGQRPLSWKVLPTMVAQVQALLRGEVVEVEQSATQMLHGDGQAPNRPIEVPWVLGVNGPKGLAVAEEWAVVCSPRPRPDADYGGLDDVILLGFGTVMDPDETVDAARVIETAGPGVAVAYRVPRAARCRLDSLPNGEGFVALATALDPETRHLALHTGHLTVMNDIDRQVITGSAMHVAPLTVHGSELPGRIQRLADQGVTEIAFQPMGDIGANSRSSPTPPSGPERYSG
ncbi:MAG: hypothetical protein R2710_01220 [Acidimicrobiales bacterium]